MSELKCKKIFVRQFNDQSESRTLYLPCNQWSCPICRKKKMKQMSYDLKKAIKNYMSTIAVDGFRACYSMKMLTLTYPGKERRSPSHSIVYKPEYTGSTTIQEACKEMKKRFNNLMTALRLKYGDYRFVCVMEPQTDGYPHFHVLLMGGGVGNRLLLRDIRKLWVEKYKMGFQVKLQVIKYGVNAGVNYVLKYLTKMTGAIFKGSRLWSVDRELLKNKEEKIINEKSADSEWVTYEVGSCHFDHLDNPVLFPFWTLEESRPVKYDDEVPF